MPMKKIIIIFGFLLVLPFTVLYAQDIDAQGKALIVAVQNQDINEIKKLINEGADVNYKSKDYEELTPLIVASKTGTAEIVEILLKAGADPNKGERRWTDTPLINAVINKANAMDKTDAEEITDLLLRAGANPNTEDSGKRTALVWAAEVGRIKIVERLLKENVDINAGANGVYTALNIAVQKGQKEIVRLLLKNNADPNILNREEKTALDYALEDNQDKDAKEITALLLHAGAKTSREIRGDDSEGDDCDSCEDEKIVCECVETKFSKATKGFIDRICLDKNISANEIDKFISEGANINARFKIGYEWYGEEDDWETTRPVFFLHGNAVLHLIKKGANIKVEGENSDTVLIHQLRYDGNGEVIKLLLDKKAAVNVSNANDETPLGIAVNNSNEEYTRLLLERKADPNAGAITIKDYNAEEEQQLTLLEYAAFTKKPAIVELLLKHGAQVNGTRAHCIAANAIGVRNESGKNAYNEEEADALWGIVRELLAKGADINIQVNDRCRTLLDYAIIQQRLDMVQYLVEHGADLTLEDYAHLAWRGRDYHNGESVKDYIYSVTETMDKESENTQGYQPIHEAIKQRDLKKVTQILQNDPSAARAVDGNGNTTLHVFFYSYYEGGGGPGVGEAIADSIFEAKKTATEKDMLPMLDLLLKNGADPLAVNKNGKTPLHAASEYEAPMDILAAIFALSADINVKDKFGQTPLHYAGYSKAAEFLINAGADVNARSEVLQRTPLHEAAKGSRPDLVAFLIKAGADKHARDKYGNTPLDLAQRCGNLDYFDENRNVVETGAGKFSMKYIFLVSGVVALFAAIFIIKRKKAESA